VAPSRAKLRRLGTFALLLVGVAVSGAALGGAGDPLRVLDRMDAIAAWRAVASDGVSAGIGAVHEGDTRALRLSFDFNGGAGYAAAERDLPLELPENFEIEFSVRGQAAANGFEFKLIDASGDNVWWYRRQNFRFQEAWQTVRIKRRQIEFAWGPSPEHALHRIAKLQLLVSAGKDSGAGSVEIGVITIRSIAPAPAEWPAPSARGSRASVADSAALAVDGDPHTAWRCRRMPGRPCELELDYGLAREFGGLRIEWEEGRHASVFELSLSDDAEHWRTVRRVRYGVGGVDHLWLPESEARYVRLRLEEGPAPEFGLAELTLLDPAVGASRNAFIGMLSATARRGTYPRGFTEQCYWTLVGIDGGAESGLLAEDGALEVSRGGVSIEPFVVESGRVWTWADVAIRHSLADRYLPVPSVEWRAPRWTLAVTAFGADGPGSRGLWARYRLENRSAQALHLRLVLATRPFQVNPPSQFLNAPGGVSQIDRLDWSSGTLTVNGVTSIVSLVRPDRVGAFAFDEKAIPAGLAGDAWRPVGEMSDESGFESGAIAYEVELAADAAALFGLFVPWPTDMRAPGARADLAALATAEVATMSAWRTRLNRVTIDAPDAPEAQEMANALRTALAHILISRDGPMLRPGTRSYARSWIRDGAMMSDALLRLGEAAAPQEYLRWYAGFIFPNGKVPCCVDARGADPVPENDSSGEFIYLAAEVWRRTHDRALLQAVWPKVLAATVYLEEMHRAGRAETQEQGRSAAFYGLVPASISHEGYSAKPMHSYWDDFWALRGYTDAVFLAREFGAPAEARALASEREEFAEDLAASLRLVTAERGLDYLPGAAELGDFDATSTTIALAPGGGPLALPDGILVGTFDRYWREFVARRDNLRVWEDYTPYEWRTVGTFVRLGWPERAHAALQWFMADRRPLEWNQWPEVIGREPRVARFIGDLPHGWVSSDFIAAALDLLAWDRDSDQAVVLAAGVPPEWLMGRGVAVRGLQTRFGSLEYVLRRRGDRTELRIAATSKVPPGGFVLRQPDDARSAGVRVNGAPAQWRHGELRISAVPARIVFSDRSPVTH
jgi:hypothetical protein